MPPSFAGAIVSIALLALGAASARADTILASGGPLVVAAEPLRVPLAPLAPGAASPAAEVHRLLTSKRILLVVRGVQADRPTGTTYNVFLDLPPQSLGADASDPHYVGTLSLFNSIAGGAGRPISLDTTALVRTLAANGALDAPLVVTIEPVGGAPAPVRIQSVELSAE